MLIAFLSALVIIFTTNYRVFAAPTHVIDAYVKVNVCGDRVREGSEACDLTDLGGLTCKDLGYKGGALSCESDCTYYENLCNNNASSEEGDSSSENGRVSEQPEGFVSTMDRNNTNIILPTENALLQHIQIFDENNDGQITRLELFSVVSKWVNLWRSKSYSCDLNFDSICDVKDFSILSLPRARLVL